MSDGAPLIEIRGLGHTFGSVTALADVTLDIRQNEFFALLGPSGCGKTTLLRVLAGFEHPAEGTVTLEGRDLLALPPNRRPVNLMFQSYALFPHLSVGRNIAYGLQREGLPRDVVRARVAEVLATVRLPGFADRRPSQLSGGQRQRVALARAIVKRPRLLLLDEPLSALDRKVRAEMQVELKRLQHEVGITFAVVTHDQEEAMSMADRIAVMAEGRIHQIDSPVELYQQPRTVFVADFIGDSNLFHGTAEPGGVLVDGRLLPAGGERAAAMPPGAPSCLVVRPEDVALVSAGAGHLIGRVVDTRFLGGVSTVTVSVPGHASPVRIARPGPPSVTRGSDVHLAWDPARVVVLPSTERLPR